MSKQHLASDSGKLQLQFNLSKVRVTPLQKAGDLESCPCRAQVQALDTAHHLAAETLSDQ